MVNEPRTVYMRMYVHREYVRGLAIMNDNNVLQTKFIGYNQYSQIPASFTSNPFHMVIEDVWKNMETSTSDANMNYNTNLYINNRKYTLWCTWTSTIEPDNTRVELKDCKVVDTSGSIVTAKCVSETTWNESVFNRIPIWISGNAQFGHDDNTNRVLFNTEAFQTEGFITQSWDGSTRYKVSANDGTSLTFNDQFTIKKLPTDFVSHWVNMNSEALMGKDGYIEYAMLVPPKSP